MNRLARLIYLTALGAVLSGCGQSTQHQARQQAEADITACRNRYPAERGTYQALADCFGGVMTRENAGGPNADLLDLYGAQASALGAKVDQGVLTPTDARLQLAQAWSDIQQRALQRQQIQGQQVAGGLTPLQIAQQSLQRQQQIGQDTLRAMTPPRPVQTNCNAFGTTINCTSY